MRKFYLFIIFSFLYIPILTLITLSFNKSGLPTSWGGFSINWYYELFENKKIFKALLNTIIVAFFSTIIAGLLGTLLAMGMELRKSNKYIEATAFIPMIIPDIVMAISLLSFLVSYYWGERRIFYLVLVSIIFPIIVFIFFETILGLRFPPGIITNIYYKF